MTPEERVKHVHGLVCGCYWEPRVCPKTKAVLEIIASAEREAAEAERLRISDDLMESAKIAEEMGARDRSQALAWVALDLRKTGAP